MRTRTPRPVPTVTGRATSRYLRSPTAAEPPTGPTTLPPIPAEDAAPATPIPADPVEPTSSDSGNEWILLALLGAAALAVAAPPIGRRIRRRSTRSPSEQVANNWERAVDALRLVDVADRQLGHAGRNGVGHRAARFRSCRGRCSSLADTITLATYAEPGTVDLDHVGAYGASTVRDGVALDTPDRTSGQRFDRSSDSACQPLLHPLEVSATSRAGTGGRA